MDPVEELLAYEHIRQLASRYALALDFRVPVHARPRLRADHQHVLAQRSQRAHRYRRLRVDARWVEALFVTPRLHRRHHVPSTTQHNFGAVFTVWDRCLGTLIQAETTPDERYGVPGEIDSYPQRFIPAFRHPLIQRRQQRAVSGGRAR